MKKNQIKDDHAFVTVHGLSYHIPMGVIHSRHYMRDNVDYARCFWERGDHFLIYSIMADIALFPMDYQQYVVDSMVPDIMVTEHVFEMLRATANIIMGIAAKDVYIINGIAFTITKVDVDSMSLQTDMLFKTLLKLRGFEVSEQRLGGGTGIALVITHAEKKVALRFRKDRAEVITDKDKIEFYSDIIIDLMTFGLEKYHMHLENPALRQYPLGPDEVRGPDDILTIEKLATMTEGYIFDTGVVTEPGLYKDPVRWVAVRGGGDNDWAIYYHRAEKSVPFVKTNGDKCVTETIIKKLVPCTDEAYATYRR